MPPVEVTRWAENAFGEKAEERRLHLLICSNGSPMPYSAAPHHRTVGRLREQMAEAERVRMATEEELAAINALPDALLRRAFSGEL